VSESLVHDGLHFFVKNLTSFKTPTRMVGCDFSGLIFGDLTDSHADSPGSIPVTATKDRHPLPVTRSRLRRRPAARRQAGMTTKARASAGEWRGLFAPRGVGGGRALSRGALTGAAADARRLPPLPAGRWWPAVTWVSGTAVSRSVAPGAPVIIVRRQSMPRHHRRGRAAPRQDPPGSSRPRFVRTK
jgi:hypothetical protein